MDEIAYLNTVYEKRWFKIVVAYDDSRLKTIYK